MPRSADAARAWLEVDLDAIVGNARSVAARARVPLLPMVKADAYGLGAVPVVRALETIDPWGYGVATLQEGVELRAAGVSRPIVVFNPLLVGELPDAWAHRLSPALSEAPTIAQWGALSGNAPWHLAIDTGMSRSGVPWSAADSLRPIVAQYAPLAAWTHFHSADADDGSMAAQIGRFEHALGRLPSRPPVLHIENSAAIERLTGPSRWSLVRPGLFLYGVGSVPVVAPAAADRLPTSGPAQASSDVATPMRSRPVVAFRARVIDLRWIDAGESVSYGATFRPAQRRRIATVGAGYGDGYRRGFSNVGHALVRGSRAPVAGVVTMDMTMLDVTGIDCAIGDVATLLGGDPAGADRDNPSGNAPVPPGRGAIDVADAAHTAGLCAYELLTGLRVRLPRVYVGRSDA